MKDNTLPSFQPPLPYWRLMVDKWFSRYRKGRFIFLVVVGVFAFSGAVATFFGADVDPNHHTISETWNKTTPSEHQALCIGWAQQDPDLLTGMEEDGVSPEQMSDWMADHCG